MANTLPILDKDNIKIVNGVVSKIDAIKASGKLLVDKGYVTEKYIDSMIKRDEKLSVYLGSFLAIPHGEYSGKNEIMNSGVSVIVYPDGIDWDGEVVKVVMCIAGLGDDHMEILSNTAEVFSEEENIDLIVNAKQVDDVYALLSRKD